MAKTSLFAKYALSFFFLFFFSFFNFFLPKKRKSFETYFSNRLVLAKNNFLEFFEKIIKKLLKKLIQNFAKNFVRNVFPSFSKGKRRGTATIPGLGAGKSLPREPRTLPKLILQNKTRSSNNFFINFSEILSKANSFPFHDILG